MLITVALVAAAAAGGAVWGLRLMGRGPSGRVARLILAMEERPAPSRALRPLRPFLPEARLAEVALLLNQAGRPHGLDARQFLTIKLLLAALTPALVALFSLSALGGLTLPLMLLAGLAAFMSPDLWLNGQVAHRRLQAQAELPLFADLVASAISAGLPLPDAVRRVAADMPGLVAREFLRAVQEMAAAKPRLQAWRDLIDRVPGEDFRSLVQSIMQAEQHGTGVAAMLHYQVRQIRALRQAEAQRSAQAASVRMRIPMLLLILFPFMLLLLGPALLQVAELLL